MRVCVCVRACACVCCGLGGKPDVCCSGGQAASHPPAVRAPPTIQPENCPSGPRSRSRSGASDLVTHSFNNGLRICDVLNIILGPEDTPMGRKEKTHSFGLLRCPSSRDAPANAGDAGPTTGWGRPHTPRGKRHPAVRPAHRAQRVVPTPATGECQAQQQRPSTAPINKCIFF